MTYLALAAVLFQLDAAPVRPAISDTAAVLRAARNAQRNFERLSRERAPLTHVTFGTRCDEIVGRFCLAFSDRPESLPAPVDEPDIVIDARRQAIEALRGAFSLTPGDFAVTGPLVRYLVEDERAAEAASAARAYLALSRDTLWGSLLLGFALHAEGDDAAAERFFDDALGRMPEPDRARVEDLRWLLEPAEQRLYRRLTERDRSHYNDAFWTLADPLYLTPGNERRAQHVARHVWSRMLERAPIVRDMLRWGEDLEQLTVRYGIPTSRLRSMGFRTDESSIVERYDPEMLAYTLTTLRTRGVPPAPLPGEAWPLEQPRARSGYAPRTLRRLVPLEHQVSRFPDGNDVVLRADGVLALDSAAAAAAEVAAGFFVLDSTYSLVSRTERTTAVVGERARFTFEQRLPPGEYVYSLESLEAESRLGGRARYATTLERGGSLALSDLVIAEPFGAGARPTRHRDDALRPLPGLVVDPQASIGLYAEVHGLEPGASGVAGYRVEITRRRADDSTIPAQVVRWLGRRLGLAGPDASPTVTWSGEAFAGRPAAIAVDVDLGGASAGLHAFEIVVTDLRTGQSVRSLRVIRVEVGGFNGGDR
jgi:hypothetical protein